MTKDAGQTGSFDSGQEYLAKVYAKALLGVTEANGTTVAVLDELDSVLADVFDKLPQLEATLVSLRVSHEDKLRILDQAFGGKMSVDLLNFLKVVSRHGRLDCLRTIQRVAKRLYDDVCGRVPVVIRTAEALDEETLVRVRERLKQLLDRDVVLETKVDPSIIGGLVIRVGDTVYDASVAAAFEQMRSGAVEQTMQSIRQSVSRFVAS